MGHEDVLYAGNEGIRITTSRAVFRNRTFVVANITSVFVEKVRPSRAPGVLVMLLSPVVFVGGLDSIGDVSPGLLFGMSGFVLLAGLWLIFMRQPSYAVQIASAAGEVQPWSSKKKEEVEAVVQALNEAIIQTG